MFLCAAADCCFKHSLLHFVTSATAALPSSFATAKLQVPAFRSQRGSPFFVNCFSFPIFGVFGILSFSASSSTSCTLPCSFSLPPSLSDLVSPSRQIHGALL